MGTGHGPLPFGASCSSSPTRAVALGSRPCLTRAVSPPEPETTTLQGDPQEVPYIAYPGAAGVLLSVWIGHQLDLGPRLSSLFVIGFIVFIVSISRRVTLDGTRRQVRQSHLLFGRWPARTENFPYEDLAAVCFRPFNTGEENRVTVGVRLRNGRRLWLRSFDVAEGHGPLGNLARAYARQVSTTSGVPIEDPPG